MPRKLRAAAQAAAKSMKNVPAIPDVSDDEMVDAPPSQPSSTVEEPRESVEKETDADPDVEPEPEVEAETAPETEAQANTPADFKPEDETSAATPAVDDFTQLEGGDTPSYTGGRQSAVPRKRRVGRPPKNRPPDWDAPDGAETPIRVTAPVKRRRGRPAASGGRWARNRGPSHNTQVPIDKEGNMMDVINDEVALPPDEEGDTKVDENGHLKGGREYRVRTFTLLNRGDRLYMLSTEPARCIGFRDSYLFFQKHKMLYKIIIDDDEKRDLIERDLIPHSYKGRAIGVVTARSVFREFGARIVVGGKKVDDEYHAQAAREPYNRNQYVAWHGASSVYHTNAPSVPLPGGKPVDSKKRRVPVTDDNWMLEHARAASVFNSKLADMRRTNLGGVYDVHTNSMQYPKIMQPTHARWERVPPQDTRITASLMTDMSSLNITNNASADTEPIQNTTTEPHDSTATPETTEEKPSTIFPPVPTSISNRYLVQDVVYESPPYSNMGIPAPDGDVRDIGPNGLVSIANPSNPEFMNPEIVALLPLECQEALIDAAAREVEWKSRWSTETQDGARTKPTKNYGWFP
ncbi:Chromatin-remodelling complex RSC SWI/SNF subunit Rsc7/Swp82 [Penicillium alfredii]|uniref:Chromatin-remodelling complex RSC SWI/SNF subunit Rsc7/Swp82 n=1 Tax=Penicillium alfredii TaxID=1506179 RepID=A0A9W9EMG6_9EURO|nr:Chromatin-remodelling complex RSC SWI/SNF subunit Rsc7/Swp82 [Penicillium alfredii]KAJ5084445.1 Chromatin-remodelling complex RSC SWI/SNF subunit Rsc7/Swp82 [Penicillium alfredii]